MSADKFHYVVYDGHISTKFKLKLSHQMFWAVLTRESAAGLKQISFYNTHAEFMTGLQPQFFLELRNILRVQQVETKVRTQRPYQFKIVSTSGTQLIATKTAEECQKWVKSMTDLLQGIQEPNVVYEFQIVVLPGGHADRLNLNGSYILKVFESSLKLFSACGNIPTDFHCSLANATIICTATNIHEYEAGMLTIQTSSNADIGEGELAFSAKSAIDFIRVVEHRRKSTSKNEATTLRKQRSLSLSEITRPSLPHSRNIRPDPELLADESQHQCHSSPMKLPRQGVPVFPGHDLESILFHDSALGSNKISVQPKSSQWPSSTTLPNHWKPIPPPKPRSRPASPNPSHSRPLKWHSNMDLSNSHSRNHISTASTTPSGHSNFLKVLLPVPHHKITHANKSDVEDSAKSSLPSAASQKSVARFPPKEQAKVHFDPEPKSVKEGSRNEAAQKRSMYFNKSAGDSGDYEINDIGIGNDNSSCIDPIVEKNMAYGVVEMRLGDKPSPVVTAIESSVYECVDMEIGNGPIGKMNTRRSSDYAYVDMEFEKPPTTVEESLGGDSGIYEYVDMSIGNGNSPNIVEKSRAGEAGDYDYICVGFHKPPSTVKTNPVGESTVGLQVLQQKETIGDNHPALVGLEGNGAQKARDTATSSDSPKEEGLYVIENLKEDQSVGDTTPENSRKVHRKKQGSPRPPLPPRPPQPGSRPKQISK